jgi:hypothetical protein
MEVWSQGPQSYLAENTCWGEVGKGRSQYIHTLPNNSPLSEAVDIT